MQRFDYRNLTLLPFKIPALPSLFITFPSLFGRTASGNNNNNNDACAFLYTIKHRQLQSPGSDPLFVPTVETNIETRDFSV